MALVKLLETAEKIDNLKRWHRAVVKKNDDPKCLGRIKVYIKGLLEEVDDLEKQPWVFPLAEAGLGADIESSGFVVPELESEVVVVFPFGDIYYPVYIGRWRTEPTLEEEYQTDYPETYGWRDKTGNVLIVNKEQETIEFTHSSGIHLLLTKEGTCDLYVPQDILVQVDRDIKVKANQDIFLESGRDFNLKVGRFLTAEVVDNTQVTLKKKLTLEVDEEVVALLKKNFSLEVDEDVMMLLKKQLAVDVGESATVTVANNATLNSSDGDIDVNSGAGIHLEAKEEITTRPPILPGPLMFDDSGDGYRELFIEKADDGTLVPVISDKAIELGALRSSRIYTQNPDDGLWYEVKVTTLDSGDKALVIETYPDLPESLRPTYLLNKEDQRYYELKMEKQEDGIWKPVMSQTPRA